VPKALLRLACQVSVSEVVCTIRLHRYKRNRPGVKWPCNEHWLMLGPSPSAWTGRVPAAGKPAVIYARDKRRPAQVRPS